MSVLNKQMSMPSLPSLRLRKPSRAARRTATVTGLEIGATKAIAAQARLQGDQIVAERVADRQLPPGLMRDGLVTDPERLASELKSLFSEHKLSKRVRVGLATPRTVLRVIDLPPLDDKDIRTALVMQAQERIPMPLDRAVMDFHKVGLVDTSEGQRLRVIVVVTEREGVDRSARHTAPRRAEARGHRPFGVLGHPQPQPSRPGAEGPVLYAQLGDLVNIAIAEDGLCRFTRQAPQGLAMVLGRLAENRSIPLEEAHALLHNGDDDDRSPTATSPSPTFSSAPRWSSGQSCAPPPSSTRPSSGQRSSPPVWSRARWLRCPGSSRRCRQPRASSSHAARSSPALRRPGRRRRTHRARGHRPGRGSARVMNAVNLIPADRRKRSVSVSVSPLTLGVIGGLVVVLVAAVLYVFAMNDVRARKSELARVTANAASWQAAANSYTSYVTAAQQQKQQLADIRQLVTGRFPWSMLLSQIGGVMPADAALQLAPGDIALGGRSTAARRPRARHATTPTTQAVRSPAVPRRNRRWPRRWWRWAGCTVSARSRWLLDPRREARACLLELGLIRGRRMPVPGELLAVTGTRVAGGLGAASGATTPASTSTTPAATPRRARRDHPVNRERPMTLRKRDRIVLAVVAASPSSGRSTCWPSSPSASRPVRWSRRSPPSGRPSPRLSRTTTSAVPPRPR